MTKSLTFETKRFGRIEARREELIRFPGLPGFPQARRFVVRRHDRGSALGWLVSVDEPDLAFVVCDPWSFFPDYAPEIGPRDLRAVGARKAEELEILTIVNAVGQRLSVNLAAPLVINPRKRRGLQIILEDRRYPTRAAVEPRGSLASPSGGKAGE